MPIKIGFLTLTWIDVIDILILTIIIYRIYMVMRGTIAAQIFAGLIAIIAISFIAQATNLTALTWLLRKLTDIWVLAFIILFQPEIRRVLILIGRSRFLRYFLKLDVEETIDAISAASLELSRLHYGALIVITRGTGLRTFVESGVQLHASISKQLLLSIFFPKSPLHDGAVIIKDRIIEAARCTLPLSNITRWDDKLLGMRHRAGLGVSEQADVIAVIVSEETGQISIAENGILYKNLTVQELKNRLNEGFLKSKLKTWKHIFRSTTKNYNNND
ncbi:MAG TPA: diadenylate cyclase CdaA [Bacteroidota bacterium]|nr:diadenylate cyclase CdaA [Bacteroidota bacterium]